MITTAGNLRVSDIGKQIEFDYTPPWGASEITVYGRLDSFQANASWVTVWVRDSADVDEQEPLTLTHNHPLTVEET